MSKKGIVVIICFAVIIIALCVLYFNTKNPLNQYKKEIINILNDYKENKINSEKASKELESISYRAKEKAKETENNTQSTTWFLLSTTTSNIALQIELQKIDRIEINEYVKKIKNIK